MILITGATGTIGSQLTRILAERGAAFRTMTRRPEALSGAVFGDFDDPASLSAAVQGVASVFLLTSGAADLARHDLAMLEAARQGGVRKVVKLSVIDVGPAAQWHRPGEEALAEAEFAWTVLRPTTFASNALYWAENVRSGRPIPNPTGDGRQGIVDPRDIAEVAAEVLLSDRHDGQTLTLTGPELLSVADQVAVLSTVLDRPVSTIDVAIADLRADLLASGASAEYADGVATGSQLVRAGGNAILTPDVERVLHRAPRSFETWVQDHQGAFGEAAPR
jgi:uncharacterized protein YbjT (DUF2867 family)